MKIRKIDLQSIEGFKVGNAENLDKGTGCTVIICEEGAVAGVDVRGGAPATRETDLLKSENTIQTIHSVVISGGSAFGLEAASGVMRELSERGIGFETGDTKVPIVCGASLYDLGLGSSSFFPDIEMGKTACKNAYEAKFEHGNRGAGTGASVGKFSGMTRAMKTGLGIFACADEYVKVGAVTAVNAMGDIYNGAGNIIAGFRTEDGESIHGTIKSLKTQVHNEIKLEEEPLSSDPLYTTIDERNKNKSEIAEAIRNAFSNKMKDTAEMDLPAVQEEPSVEEVSEDANIDELTSFYTSDMMGTGHYPRVSNEELSEETEVEAAPEIEEAAEASQQIEEVEDAAQHIEEPAETTAQIEEEDGVITVSDILADKPYEEPVHEESYYEPEYTPEPEAEPEPIQLDDPDMGYDISFNTTISCLITNAKMSKSQANKLASILHDAYARAIKPVHSSMDGDTIFVMTTNTQDVNFDAFAALATDVLQYAIIDAALSAKSAYGLPAACDIIQ